MPYGDSAKHAPIGLCMTSFIHLTLYSVSPRSWFSERQWEGEREVRMTGREWDKNEAWGGETEAVGKREGEWDKNNEAWGERGSRKERGRVRKESENRNREHAGERATRRNWGLWECEGSQTIGRSIGESRESNEATIHSQHLNSALSYLNTVTSQTRGHPVCHHTLAINTYDMIQQCNRNPWDMCSITAHCLFKHAVWFPENVQNTATKPSGIPLRSLNIHTVLLPPLDLCTESCQSVRLHNLVLDMFQGVLQDSASISDVWSGKIKHLKLLNKGLKRR